MSKSLATQLKKITIFFWLTGAVRVNLTAMLVSHFTQHKLQNDWWMVKWKWFGRHQSLCEALFWYLPKGAEQIHETSVRLVTVPTFKMGTS